MSVDEIVPKASVRKVTVGEYFPTDEDDDGKEGVSIDAGSETDDSEDVDCNENEAKSGDNEEENDEEEDGDDADDDKANEVSFDENEVSVANTTTISPPRANNLSNTPISASGRVVVVLGVEEISKIMDVEEVGSLNQPLQHLLMSLPRLLYLVYMLFGGKETSHN